MTTASIYYHSRGGDPEFILIDGDLAEITELPDPAHEQIVGLRINAIDHACRTLGWRVADGAAIVRQADGRGTIRIVPVSLRPGLPGRTVVDADAATLDPPTVTAEEEMRTGATALVTLGDEGLATAVFVDGKAFALASTRPMTSERQPDRQIAESAVDDALRQLGYRRTGPYGPLTDQTGEAAWGCTAEINTIAVADWRDQPTLVRMDDDTATLLNRTADLLGIPADTLASTWVRRAAADAITNYDRYTDRAYLIRQDRIKGWSHDGTPHLGA